MSRIDYIGGCKVAWEYYDNEAEARAAGERETKNAERKAKLGYDFGYQWPGSVEHLANHHEHGECWKVTCA